MRSTRHKWLLFGVFIAAELVLYALILTGADANVYYASIVLCFLYALSHFRSGDRYLIGALTFTLVADFFLVICGDSARVWGVLFFVGTQTVYAIRLQRIRPNRTLLLLRFALVLVAEFIAVLVLGENTDALAVISLAYYANLIMNIVEGFAQFSYHKLYPIGMVLFLLCDTVIGLLEAAGGYLPIGTESLLYRLLYPGFNLAWLFYLPSQVLLAISAGCANPSKEEESV